MSATFVLSTADFARYQRVVAMRFKRKIGLFSVHFALRVLIWGCVGFAASRYVRIMREYPEAAEPLQIVAVLLVVAILAISAMPYVSQVVLRKHMLEKNGAFLSPQTIELSASGLSVSSATGNTVVPWSGLLAREEDKVNYYLFIDALQALVIPRNAIASETAEFEKYTQHLRSASPQETRRN